MKLALNREYAQRHLFVAILMISLSCWFGYDGIVRYPAMPAADLYRSIEKAEAPQGFDLEAFKQQKTQTQYGFALLSLLTALIVGLRLAKETLLNFEYDDNGFSVNGKYRRYDEISSVDKSRWEKKGILSLKLADGAKVVLDSWHRLGVKEFAARLEKSI